MSDLLDERDLKIIKLLASVIFRLNGATNMISFGQTPKGYNDYRRNKFERTKTPKGVAELETKD